MGITLLGKENVNGISGPPLPRPRFYNLGVPVLGIGRMIMELVHPPTPLEVLQFGNPSSWHREDLNGISGALPCQGFYNLGVPVLGIGKMRME